MAYPTFTSIGWPAVTWLGQRGQTNIADLGAPISSMIVCRAIGLSPIVCP
jgi:hypothetical protein